MGGLKFGWLVGWLSGFRAQTGSFANWRYATFVRRLGEAAAPGRGECGQCPDFASYTLAFALQLRKSKGETSVKIVYGFFLLISLYSTVGHVVLE